MDRYEARMNLHGATQRERVKNRLINHLNDRTKHSLSYKNIILNGKETQLMINSGTQTYYKEFQSLPSQEINIGDYIELANSFWIVTTCDYDDELYRDGKLEQCNYLLKWQNELGEIIERWAIIKSASKYNDGTDANAVLSLGSDQLSIIIPIDEESIKLKKSMGKKFFIDGNKEDPTAYELTGTGNVPDTYNGHGITSWIVKECAYTPSEDDLKYGVCNYKEIYTTTTPTQNPNKTGVLRAEISYKGSSNLKIGGNEKVLIASFIDMDGNTTSDIGKWEIITIDELKPYLYYSTTDNKLEIRVLENEFIDSKVRIMFSNIDNTVSTYVDFDVISIF